MVCLSTQNSWYKSAFLLLLKHLKRPWHSLPGHELLIHMICHPRPQQSGSRKYFFPSFSSCLMTHSWYSGKMLWITTQREEEGGGKRKRRHFTNYQHVSPVTSFYKKHTNEFYDSFLRRKKHSLSYHCRILICWNAQSRWCFVMLIMALHFWAWFPLAWGLGESQCQFSAH